MGWQGAGDVMHPKRAEVCVRIWRKRELGTRRQTRRIDFWSTQTRGELTPYGGRSRRGPLKIGAKWIRQHRRLCLSSLRRNSKLIKRFRNWTRDRYVFSNSEIPLFIIWSIVMNIIFPFRTWPYSCIWLRNNIPLTLFERVVCERELEVEQNCNILTPTLMAISLSFLFSRVLNRRPGGPLRWVLVFSTTSCHQRFWSPN